MKSWPSLALICSLFISIVFIKVNDVNFGKKGNYGVIDWDNFGYYLYLPATFIYNDLKLQDDTWVKNAQQKYDLSTSFYQAHNLANGNRVIQYTAGMAVFYSPAFFCGHIIAKATKAETDGFSKPYQIAILLQSFLIIFLGLFYLRKLCLKFFNEFISFFVIVVITLGTNYIQIASANISSPHIYIFAAYAFLLYQITCWHFKPKLKTILSVGVIAAIMVLARPNELLFLLIPIFIGLAKFSSIKEKLAFFKENKGQLLAVSTPFILLGIIQPLYWNYISGEWFYDSYKNEDFKLLNPYISNYLFSYKKGWLLYTPIMILGLLGLLFTIKRNKPLGIPIAIFIGLNIWILSSWDCWWYADSFSQRSIVQSYPIFIFSFGYFFEEFNFKLQKFRYPISLILFLLIGLNLFQVWQFNKGIIHTKLMTKEYYWNVFGVTDKYEPNRELLEIDRNINYLPNPLPQKNRLIYYQNFDNNEEEFLQIDSNYYHKEGSLILDKENSTSNKIKFAYKDIADSSYCYVICRIRFKSDFEASANPFGIEFNMVDSYNGKGYGYKYRGAENISWFQKGSWSSMDLVVIPPYLRNENDSIQLNIKLFGENQVEIDNVSIEILDPSSIPKPKTETFYNDYFTISPTQWSDPKFRVGEKQFEQIDSLHPYSTTFYSEISKLKFSNKLTLEGKINLENNYSGTYAVASINKNDKNVFYKSYPIIKSKNGWQKFNFEYDLPNDLNNQGELKVYLWNKSARPTLIRDLNLEIN